MSTFVVDMRKIVQFLLLMMVAVALPACSSSDRDDSQPGFAVNPIQGTWTLQSIDGSTVTNPLDVTYYVLREDPANPTDFSGIGIYRHYDPASAGWVEADITWIVDTEGRLSVTATDGSTRVYYYSLTSQSSYFVLTLTTTDSTNPTTLKFIRA